MRLLLREMGQGPKPARQKPRPAAMTCHSDEILTNVASQSLSKAGFHREMSFWIGRELREYWRAYRSTTWLFPGG